jgi:hypothetical protein
MPSRYCLLVFRRVSTSIAFAVFLWLVLTPSGHAQRYVAGPDSLHRHLKFPDSLVSANDRCMVSQKKLNPRVRPVYVNGVPMGFC